MKKQEEKGFLSDKFEDWGSEPIPNGWAEIDRIIEPDRRKKPKAVWLVLPLLVILAGSTTYLHEMLNLNDNQQEYIAIDAPLQNLVVEKRTAESTSTIQQTHEHSIVSNSSSGLETEKTTTTLKSGKNLDKSGEKEPENLGRIVSGSKSSKIRKNLRLKNISPVIASNFRNESHHQANHGRNPKINSKVLIARHLVIGHGKENSKNQKFEGSQIPEEVGSNPILVSSVFQNGSQILTEHNTSSPIFGAETGPIFLLEPKKASLPEIAFSVHPEPFRIQVKEDFPITTRSKNISISVSLLGGITSRSIQIDHSQAAQHYSVSSSSNRSDSWFSSAGFQIQNQVTNWLSSFGTINFGIFKQVVNLKTTTKEPTSYEMKTADNQSFSFEPNWKPQTERRSQEMVFGTIEFGLKPILFHSSESGPYASAVVWASLSQTYNSSLGEVAAPFDNTNESVALSYRIGYQHTFYRKVRVEIFTAGLPDKLLASTKGLSIKPQLLGFGINYIIR